MNITEWAAQDRPREKMIANGAASLTDAELLAILIRTGNAANPNTGQPSRTALDIGRELLQTASGSLLQLSTMLIQGGDQERQQLLKGVGPAKACTIQAALELGRRMNLELEQLKTQKILITSSDVVFAQFNHLLSDLPHEELWALYCSNSGRLLHKQRISEGGIRNSSADIKKVIRPAIEYMASRIALCHNHPHSEPKPSTDDINVTQQIKQACQLIDVQLMDHIIIADGRYYSFADNGMI